MNPRRLGSETCPECHKKISCTNLHGHTASCAQWQSHRGGPWPKFKFSRNPTLYAPDAVDGVDYVMCRICATCGWDFRFRRLVQHLEVHGSTEIGYAVEYPGAPVRLQSTTDRRRETTLALYGVDNVSKSDEIKTKIGDVFEERYGARCALQNEAVKEKAAATIRLRYGVDNVFASPEIQARIRETNLERFGVGNPQQSPEIRARTVRTCQDKYGADSFLRTDAFKEKSVATSQKRYGVRHPMKAPGIQRRLATGVRALYGVDNVLSLPGTQKKAYATNLANHNGEHSQRCPEVLDKARATWLEKYGVDNPSKVPEVIARIRDVWTAKYGVPFPPQSLHFSRGEPNGLERAVDTMSPMNVVYAGNAAYWVKVSGERKTRNPDFVVLTTDQLKAWQEGMPLNNIRVTAVIEAFGDYFHGPKFTGLDCATHEADVGSFYTRAGIACLVLWETAVRKNPVGTAGRILNFLSDWEHGRLPLQTEQLQASV